MENTEQYGAVTIKALAHKIAKSAVKKKEFHVGFIPQEKDDEGRIRNCSEAEIYAKGELVFGRYVVLFVMLGTDDGVECFACNTENVKVLQQGIAARIYRCISMSGVRTTAYPDSNSVFMSIDGKNRPLLTYDKGREQEMREEAEET